MGLKRLCVVLLGLMPTSAALGQVLESTVDVDGVTREYLVYLPTGYDGFTELPVVVAYHGGSGTSYGMIPMTGFNPMADAHDFVVVYPQGLPDDYGDNIWNSEGPFTNGVDDIGFTSRMLDAIDVDHAVDMGRVYATGYSNGANMALEAACILNDQVTAAAPVAGSMWTWTESRCELTHPTSVLSIHGTFDFYNPADGNIFSMGLKELSAFWAAHNHASVTDLVTEDLPDLDPTDGSTVTAHSVVGQGCAEVTYYEVVRGGHDWPGMWGNMDIDSSQEIWDFVSQFDMNGKIGGGSVEAIGVGAEGANIATLGSGSTPTLGAPLTVDWSGFEVAATGTLYVSAARAEQSLLGGTVYPDMSQLLMAAAVSTAADGTGSHTFTLPDDPTLSGSSFYLQVAMPDASQSEGWAFSNAVAATACH